MSSHSGALVADVASSRGTVVLTRILALPQNWHRAGTFPNAALETLDLLARRGELNHTMETGSGRSTLLLSHLSSHHTVFSIDDGNSIANVRHSELLNVNAVTFVEGPTQQTLSKYTFDHPLDFALLDGPHAYPFPDLEYYFVYPHLRVGGLLVIDDIHIPTVRNLYRFLCKDAMFEVEAVTRNTAFFRRTSAPTFDPLGDGWVDQNYNKGIQHRHPTIKKLGRVFPVPVRRVVSRVLAKFR